MLGDGGDLFVQLESLLLVLIKCLGLLIELEGILYLEASENLLVVGTERACYALLGLVGVILLVDVRDLHAIMYVVKSVAGRRMYTGNFVEGFDAVGILLVGLLVCSLEDFSVFVPVRYLGASTHSGGLPGFDFEVLSDGFLNSSCDQIPLSIGVFVIARALFVVSFH